MIHYTDGNFPLVSFLRAIQRVEQMKKVFMNFREGWDNERNIFIKLFATYIARSTNFWCLMWSHSKKKLLIWVYKSQHKTFSCFVWRGENSSIVLCCDRMWFVSSYKTQRYIGNSKHESWSDGELKLSSFFSTWIHNKHKWTNKTYTTPAQSSDKRHCCI